MKKGIYCGMFLLALTVTSCKKEIDSTLKSISGQQQNDVAIIRSTHLPLTVETIAGSMGRPSDRFGYRDGVGTDARFNNPQGIELLADGTIYVADELNKKVRKISSGKVATTVIIPENPDHIFLLPRAVKVSKDGTMNILMNEIDGYRKLFIWKPGSAAPLVPPYKNTDYHYFDIARDPYNDYFWLCGIKPVYNNGKLSGYNGLLDKLLLNGLGIVGTDSFVVPQNALNSVDQQTPFVSTLVIGHNKVKYLVIYKSIYKLTPSGVFTQINRDIIPFRIFHMAANKDNQTLYLSLETGGIYALTDGRLRYLVGPNSAKDGRDGVGRMADVHANDLALSKDESMIYFTDWENHSIRKLYLK